MLEIFSNTVSYSLVTLLYVTNSLVIASSASLRSGVSTSIFIFRRAKNCLVIIACKAIKLLYDTAKYPLNSIYSLQICEQNGGRSRYAFTYGPIMLVML